MKYVRKYALYCVVLVLVVSGSYWAYYRAQIHIDPTILYPVAYVSDGDTFKVSVDTHVITVRMLGIDTPETVDPRKPIQCFGKEASDETKSLLSGRKVRLSFNPNRELKDKYERYLAYVYRDDGLFLNKFLLKNGFAREYTFRTPYDFQGEFRSAQIEAQKDKLGLWKECKDNK